MDPLEYQVRCHDLDGHRFHVRLTVPDPDPAGQILQLPRWIPGSYLIREFARHWVEIRAHSNGRPLALEPLDGHRWRAAPSPAPLTIEAEIHAHDRSIREAYLDRRLGFFNGTSLFLLPQGQHQRPCRLEILPPDLPWCLATTLTPEQTDANGFGHYLAEDYAELIDHPVLMGPIHHIPFHAGGLPHSLDLVAVGERPLDTARIQRDLQRLCETQQRLFGAPPPIERYRFLGWASEKDYGGLEHRASSALIFPRDDLPGEDEAPDPKGYRRFLGLCSHEYLHTWWVKRIRPQRLAEADLSQEAHTRDLWVFEGITSYYDDLALVRSGVISAEDYLSELGELITRVLRTPGRRHQSIAQSSFHAWTKLYRADAHAPNLMVSYYSKGALTALALDLHLRRESEGRHNLDDVLAALWDRYRQDGAPLPEGGLPPFIERLTGIDLGEFVRRYVDGTEDPPLAELLEQVMGIRLHLRRPEGPDDSGGRPGKEDDPQLARRGWLGCRLDPDSDRIAAVRRHSPAEAAGLAPGDRLLAIDGQALDPNTWWQQIARRPAGSRIRLHYRHDGLLHQTDTVLAPPPRDTAWLEPLDDIDPATAERRRRWLHG